jgi:hypothetical protein
MSINYLPYIVLPDSLDLAESTTSTLNSLHATASQQRQSEAPVTVTDIVSARITRMTD